MTYDYLSKISRVQVQNPSFFGTQVFGALINIFGTLNVAISALWFQRYDPARCRLNMGESGSHIELSLTIGFRQN